MEKLQFKFENNMLPFLWVHGEDEATYRKLIKAIDEASIKAFCVESRPHEEFLQDKWWKDMDIILDEAKKRNMGVYILDDKHFPTGYANGAAINAPARLRRKSIFNKTIKLTAGEEIDMDLMELCKWTPDMSGLGGMMMTYFLKDIPTFDDDELYSVTAYYESSFESLDNMLEGTHLKYKATKDVEINLCFLSRNTGIHRDYINMLEEDAVKILLDEVYESHYKHYKDEFGKTILGFFSDEPELGNSTYVNLNTGMGVDANNDFPFSETLDKRLAKVMGSDYKNLLPLIWKNDYDSDLTSKVRYQFMSTLTDLVSETFSKQIGEWCRDRGVVYIGHVIEDNNAHGRTGSSLGHYFKGLKYQSMAGIDDIGGQVYPFREDDCIGDGLQTRDGHFYHYTLGKLGVSMASINPLQKGRTMCEIFGNYGWSEGVYLEKYLLDHFMVRGVNVYVPHAFTCTSYPEPDCPPHFYAMGNNPQYRHFAKLMEYGNRVCSIISDGKIDSRVAILYHAEEEWCGKAMLNEVPAEALYDNNIDYTFIPSEVFEQTDFYKTNVGKTIDINGNSFDLFVIGESERIPESVSNAIKTLVNNGGDVVFVNSLPVGTCEGGSLCDEINKCKVLSVEELADYAKKYQHYVMEPLAYRVRVLHYIGQKDVYFLVNEAKETYNGKLVLDEECDVTLYDAYEDKCYKANYVKEKGQTVIDISLIHRHSIMVVKGLYEAEEQLSLPLNTLELSNFDLSICRAIDYPNFNKEDVPEFFSGFMAYETKVNLNTTKAVLEISDAKEGVELFVNGKSQGIQLIPPFVYDISKAVVAGENNIRIEIATTLENERCHDIGIREQMAIAQGMELPEKNPVPVGLTGVVKLYTK